MEIITYNELHQTLETTMDKVCDNRTPLVITREEKPAVVMMSLDDYKSFQETSYLLRSPKNAQRLIESICELEAGGGREQELIEE